MNEYAFSYDKRTSTSWLVDSLNSYSYSSKGSWVAVAIALLFLVYNLFLRLDFFPLLPPSELFWNALVFLTPARLAISLDKRRNPEMYANDAPEAQSKSEMHAFKAEALRRVFGLETSPLSIIPGASSIRRASWLGGSTRSDAPPGLGNWDNSCYQNSVLQGLSALRSLTTYLEESDAISQQDSSTTAGSLRETMSKLNDATNNGRRIWTPAKLKSMSSWQQQDAQEYFSKIMDDMEKETAKVHAAKVPSEGLKDVKKWDPSAPAEEQSEKDAAATDSDPEKPAPMEKTPLDGNLAQRVACLQCGFSEGLSMIPFNCLTVPLGNDFSYDLAQCLDSYTDLEEISGVECAKCTLLQQKTQLETKINQGAGQDNAPAESTASETPLSITSLPPALRQMFMDRLEAVQQALDDSDFSDATLSKKCQIPKKARVSSTKTRQAVIARAPTGLVVHVNRSMFDEYTGDLRKNTAQVHYPKVLDLGPWCLGTKSMQDAGKEEWRMNPAKSMIAGSGWKKSNHDSQYVLRAAVCHSGKHENGHYICYREHPEVQQEGYQGSEKMKWWRLSDDHVFAVTEGQVLAQGDVFMLFYERMETSLAPEKAAVDEKAGMKMSPLTEVEDEEDESAISDKVDEPAVIEGTEPTVGLSSPMPEAGDAPDAPDAPEIVSRMEPERKSSIEANQLARSATPAEQSPSQQTVDVRNVPNQPTMRTARRGSKKSRGGFESAFRAVAAT